MQIEHPIQSALGGAALALSLCVASASAAAQATAAEVEAGRKLYMGNACFSCHGTVGQGAERGGAPKLAPGPHPFEAFRALVRNPRDGMPRYLERFVSDDQLLSMHRYLASIPKGPAAKDIALLQP